WESYPAQRGSEPNRAAGRHQNPRWQIVWSQGRRLSGRGERLAAPHCGIAGALPTGMPPSREPRFPEGTICWKCCAGSSRQLSLSHFTTYLAILGERGGGLHFDCQIIKLELFIKWLYAS